MNGRLSPLKSALQAVALPENVQSPFNQLLELLDAVLIENQQLREQNQQLLQRVKLLEEQLAVYRQEKFGRQSEKSSTL